MVDHLDVANLGPLTRLGSGSQGVVFAAPNLRMRYASSLVFKQYQSASTGSLDVAALESMPTFLESLPFADGMELLSQAAWPCRLVEEHGTVTGFVMPAIPEEFYMQMMKSSGMSRERAEFQHLLNDEGFLARRRIDLTDKRRLELLREVAQALSTFHRHGIAVGDLSPRNLLFSCDPVASVYFVDCDAMRVRGRSVSGQLETPGWEVRAVNQAEELATAASDSYKLGLLALRLLVGDQDTRDITRLPATVPQAVRRLTAAALSADPARRPGPTDWIAPLDTAAAVASTKTPRIPAAAAAIRPPAMTPAAAAPRTGRQLAAARTPATAARQATAPAPATPRPQRRRRRALVITVLVVVLAVGGTTAGLLLSHQQPSGPSAIYGAVSPDGKLIASAQDSDVYIWNAATGKVIKTLSTGYLVRDIAFSPDGQTVAVSTMFTVAIWDIRTGKVKENIPTQDPYGIAFSPDGKTLALCDYKSLVLWDTVRNRVTETLTLPSVESDYQEALWTAFSPNGKTVAVSYTSGNTLIDVELWDIHTKRVVTSIPPTPTGTNGGVVAFSRDGRVLVTSDRATSFYMWNISGQPTLRATLTGTMSSTDNKNTLSEGSTTYSPDGRTLATAGWPNDGASIWNAATGKQIAKLTAPDSSRVDALAYTPDGKTLVTANDDGKIYLWNIATHSITSTLTDPG